MPTRRFDSPIDPMTLGNMRRLGVRSLAHPASSMSKIWATDSWMILASYGAQAAGNNQSPDGVGLWKGHGGPAAGGRVAA